VKWFFNFVKTCDLVFLTISMLRLSAEGHSF